MAKNKKIPPNFKYQIWIEQQKLLEFNNDELTNKESLLIQNLNYQGNWQSELIKFGFNSTLINSMVRKNLLIKTKRKKNI